MMHDLIQLPNARISLTAINAIVDEVDEHGARTGVVQIQYGPYNTGLSFEGTSEDVMKFIDNWCAERLAGPGD